MVVTLARGLHRGHSCDCWGNHYPLAETDSSTAKFVQGARYVFSSRVAYGRPLTNPQRFVVNVVAMILSIALQGVALWAFFFLPHIRRKDDTLFVVGIGTLLVCLSAKDALGTRSYSLLEHNFDLPVRRIPGHHTFAFVRGSRVFEQTARQSIFMSSMWRRSSTRPRCSCALT